MVNLKWYITGSDDTDQGDSSTPSLSDGSSSELEDPAER